MILLFTDFGVRDPYVGQLHAAIRAINPTVPIIDLFHSAPVFHTRAAAILLDSFLSKLSSPYICVAVVDPGVGSDRLPLLIECENGIVVGPDNGLLSGVISSVNARAFSIEPAGADVSVSFHGRDIFAPTAASLASGEKVQRTPLRVESLVQFDLAAPYPKVVYVDHFGNLITGLRLHNLVSGAELSLGETVVTHARIFSEVPVGSLFWYENSSGLIEIAANQASAAVVCGAGVGCDVVVC